MIFLAGTADCLHEFSLTYARLFLHYTVRKTHWKIAEFVEYHDNKKLPFNFGIFQGSVPLPFTQPLGQQLFVLQMTEMSTSVSKYKHFPQYMVLCHCVNVIMPHGLS